MNVAALSLAEIVLSQSSYVQSSAGGEGFAAAINNARTPSKQAHEVFGGAPPFVENWAEKYGVDIYREAITSSSSAGRTQALENEGTGVTVHIHPIALKRMETDLEFRQQVENQISLAKKLAEESSEEGIQGYSVLVHADGEINTVCHTDEESVTEDDEYFQMLMRRVDRQCAEMKQTIQEKVQAELKNEILKKSLAEGRYQRIALDINSAPPQISEVSVSAQLLKLDEDR